MLRIEERWWREESGTKGRKLIRVPPLLNILDKAGIFCSIPNFIDIFMSKLEVWDMHHRTGKGGCGHLCVGLTAVYRHEVREWVSDPKTNLTLEMREEILNISLQNCRCLIKREQENTGRIFFAHPLFVKVVFANWIKEDVHINVFSCWRPSVNHLKV